MVGLTLPLPTCPKILTLPNKYDYSILLQEVSATDNSRRLRPHIRGHWSLKVID